MGLVLAAAGEPQPAEGRGGGGGAPGCEGGGASKEGLGALGRGHRQGGQHRPEGDGTVGGGGANNRVGGVFARARVPPWECFSGHAATAMPFQQATVQQ